MQSKNKMPMEDIDKNEVSDDGISDEEELLHREVIQGDADLLLPSPLPLGSFFGMGIIFKG